MICQVPLLFTSMISLARYGSICENNSVLEKGFDARRVTGFVIAKESAEKKMNIPIDITSDKISFLKRKPEVENLYMKIESVI